MSIERTRNLSPDFIKDVLPHIMHPPMPPGDFNREMVSQGMIKMNENKEKALHTYWSHLIDAVKIQDIKIPMRDGHEVLLRIYEPTKATASAGSRNVLYSMHGGGFVAGNLESEDLISSQLCATNDLVIFSLDYRLAPETKVYPTIYSDAEDGFLWTFKNASKYGGNTRDGIYLSGTSSGGAMASCLAFRAPALGIKVRGLVMRQSVFIFGPYEKVAKKEWLPKLKSREENADAPLLDGTMVAKLNALIDFPEDAVVDPNNCPIFASKEQLAIMPPSYFVKAPVDPVADEVQLFADRLAEAGVPVKVKEYPGMPHGFHGHHILKCARDEMVDTAEAVKELIRNSK